MSSSDTPAQPAAPRLNVLSQYVQSLRFVNAAAIGGSPAVGKPTINVQVNVEPKALGQDRYSVLLTFAVGAKGPEKEVFSIDLEYGGVFLLQNIPMSSLPAVLAIECPRLLFPFARQVIADVTQDGGFPPLLLDPIDFATLFRRQAEARAAEVGAPTEAKIN